MYRLDEPISIDKKRKHTIEIVVDRIVIKDEIRRRVADSVETAAALSGGIVVAENADDGTRRLYNQNYACAKCGISMEELSPRMFSFNNPFGACPTCLGLGYQMKIDPDYVIRDKSKSINEGAINATGWSVVSDECTARMYL